MPVYLIRAGDAGPVKIGWSERPWLRLSKMQSDNHEPLRIIRLLEGGAPLEATIHERLAVYRLRGEWYRYTNLVLMDFGAADLPILPLPSAPRVPVGTPDGLRLAIMAAGGRSALSKILGHRSHTSVLKWNRVPTSSLLAVEAATGIPREQLRPDLYRAPDTASAA